MNTAAQWIGRVLRNAIDTQRLPNALQTRIRFWSHTHVAPVGNRLYRRLVIGVCSKPLAPSPVANRRYSRLPVGATLSWRSVAQKPHSFWTMSDTPKF